MAVIRLLIIPALLLIAVGAHAGELMEFYRGARAQAMGNAYVGLADDEQTLFYNPAGLAGIERASLHYFTTDLTVSHDVVFGYQDSKSAFENPSGDSLNVIIGKNLYLEGQVTPMLVMPGFGVSFYADGQAAFLAQNKALPYVTLGYQTTNGLVFGFGKTLGRRGFKSKKHEFRIGAGGKWLFRRGGYTQIPLSELIDIDKGTISRLTGGFEPGVGVDLGTQYIYKATKRFRLSTGLVWNNIGDISFGGGPDPIRQVLAVGSALTYEYGWVKLNVTYDLRHLTAQTDWRKKNHAGIEFALPFLSVYGGVNQVFFTYGASFNAWLFRLTALSYAEERGSFAYQNPERRYQLRLALKIDL